MKYLLEIDRGLWMKFRGQCFEKGVTVADRLRTMVRDALSGKGVEAPGKQGKEVCITQADLKSDYAITSMSTDAMFELEMWFDHLIKERKKEKAQAPLTEADLDKELGL